MSVLFQNAFDAALLAFLAGIPERIGYSRDGRRFLLTGRVDFDERAKGLHHIDYYLELLKKAGITPKAQAPWIFLDLEERLYARAVLGVLKRPRYCHQSRGNLRSSKKWLPDRFAEVAALVVHEIGGSVLLLGGPKETGIADEILNKSEWPAVMHHVWAALSLLNLSGKTSLRELIAIIAESDVLLTTIPAPCI